MVENLGLNPTVLAALARVAGDWTIAAAEGHRDVLQGEDFKKNFKIRLGHLVAAVDELANQ